MTRTPLPDLPPAFPGRIRIDPATGREWSEVARGLFEADLNPVLVVTDGTTLLVLHEPLPRPNGRTDGPLWSPAERKWLHLKSGSVYEEIGRGVLAWNGEPAVVYRSGLGRIWVRTESEFLDGRFSPLSG